MTTPISVNASELRTNEKKCEMSREDAIEYVKQQVEEMIDIFGMRPVKVTVTMRTEGVDRDPVQKVSIKIMYKGMEDPLVQNAHSRNIQRAIDRTVAPMRRQVRRFKTEKVDAKKQKGAASKLEMNRTLRRTATHDGMPVKPLR